MNITRWLTSDVERLLTSGGGIGLATASPLQRAICRTLMGRPLGDLADDPEVLKAFGGALPVGKPKEMAIFSGVRVAKTLIAADAAIHWSQVCECAHLMPGEIPRIPVVSLSRDLATVAFNHILGAVSSSRWLSGLLVGEPTTDTIVLRHPTGRPIEIQVTAGARAGASVSARWLAGIIFDEFPKMMGSDDAVVNWDHMRAEASMRILEGGQMLHIGSPWAPYGPAYGVFTEYFGKPSARMCVVKAPAYVMNPVYWTPERCAEAKAHNPDAYITQVEAEFAAQEESLFTGIELDRVTRHEPFELPSFQAGEYAAAMDPATRGNAWTLVVVTRQGGKTCVVLARQWVGTRVEPLRPREVLEEIAGILRPYRIGAVYTDQYYLDALADMAPFSLLPVNLTEKARSERYLALRARIADGQIELSPEKLLKSDLLRLKKRVTQAGVSVVLPKTSDGRHCDYAPALLLACMPYLDDVPTPKAQLGTQEWLEAEERRIQEQWMREARRHFDE